jgi:hypothetical protein
LTTKILKKTTSAIFLAIVLIVGTFATISPSCMVGVHAQQFNGMDQRYNSYEPDYETDNKYNSYQLEYETDNKYNSYQLEYGPDYGMNSYDDKQSYGKDSNSYDKSKDSSSVTVKKIKCNNINVNLNGDIEVGASSALGALATDEAQASEDEGELGASTLGSGSDRSDGGRPSGSDSDSRFVCIDNNDNVVVEGEEPISELCEECFAANSMLQTAIENFLLQNEGFNVIGFFDSVLVIGPHTDTIEQRYYRTIM